MKKKIIRNTILLKAENDLGPKVTNIKAPELVNTLRIIRTRGVAIKYRDYQTNDKGIIFAYL